MLPSGVRSSTVCTRSGCFTISLIEIPRVSGDKRDWKGGVMPLSLPTNKISLGSHQNIGLHIGARANVVLLTYLRQWFKQKQSTLIKV